MLMIKRSARILPAIKDNQITPPQRPQRAPRGVEIPRIQKFVLGLEVNGVQDHLRADNAEFVQNEFVTGPEESEGEVLAVGREGRFALGAAGCPRFAG